MLFFIKQVFVFTDAWHQSVHFVKDPNNDEERMTFACMFYLLKFILLIFVNFFFLDRRASKAMLVTQITTFFAFLGMYFIIIH